MVSSRAVRRPGLLRLTVAGAFASFLLAACFGGPPPPPPPPPAPCQSLGSVGGDSAAPPVSDGAPVAPGEAGELAREAVAASDVRTSSGEIPLVTVEDTAGRPEITSTEVGTADEAAAVAEQAAADGDLVAVEVDAPVQVNDVSTDPSRPKQWALDKVKFEDAWAAAADGGAGQTVAVIDTGVKADHEDLAGQVLAGAYFLHSNDGATAFSGSGGTTDPNGHGTHVSGIIAAVANNAKGIAGAAPGVKILPVQVLCGSGAGWSSDVANGITWAADNDATVINLSLGGPFASSSQQEAIQYARSLGVVVVASAGNSALDGNAPSYPGAFPEVIGVAATTNTADNARASYSTTGDYLDLAAPGGEPSSNAAVAVLSTWKDNVSSYRTAAGTSMASPHVAAAAALVKAAHPAYTAVEVCTQLIRTADDLGTPVLAPDEAHGYGLVDPLEAVGLTIPVGATCT
jgi:serine protease